MNAKAANTAAVEDLDALVAQEAELKARIAAARTAQAATVKKEIAEKVSRLKLTLADVGYGIFFSGEEDEAKKLAVTAVKDIMEAFHLQPADIGVGGPASGSKGKSGKRGPQEPPFKVDGKGVKWSGKAKIIPAELQKVFDAVKKGEKIKTFFSSTDDRVKTLKLLGRLQKHNGKALTKEQLDEFGYTQDNVKTYSK